MVFHLVDTLVETTRGNVEEQDGLLLKQGKRIGPKDRVCVRTKETTGKTGLTGVGTRRIIESRRRDLGNGVRFLRGKVWKKS